MALKERKLTRKQKAFADILLKNPKMSQAEAARQTYDITNPKGATALGSRVSNNEAVLAYMSKHTKYAEKAVVSVLKNAKKQKDDTSWQRLALDSANSVLDRINGRATQKVETHNTSVNLNLSLTDLTD